MSADASIAYTPGAQNLPFGLANTNPQASNYQGDSVANVTESNLIAKEIKRAIFDSAPAQYNALKILYAKPMQYRDSDEFEYLEHGFGRSVLTVATGAAGVGAIVNVSGTQDYIMEAASIQYLGVNLVISFPDNSTGVITDINVNTITVRSVVGLALPLVNDGDKLSIKSTIRGDGMDSFENYERIATITRYNYVQFFLRACRWDRVELQKYINKGTTDYLDVDRKHKMKQLRVDLFAALFNGEKGEYILKGGLTAKGMGGIYRSMLSAGSATANPTVSGLQSAFETLAFKTNYKSEGGTRFIYGTAEMLHEFSKIYKQPGLRYAPQHHLADLELDMIKFGTMNFVLVPCELFREQSVFPAAWQRRLFVLDQDTINPVCMSGIPAMDAGTTLTKGNRGTREDFQDFYVEAQLSLEFNNPLGSFYMDIA